LRMFVMRIAGELTLLAALAALPILLAIPTVQSATTMMKAVAIREYAGAEVLKYEEVPRREPQADQIVVRVIAAGVNPVDGMIRSGMFANEKRAFPIILGGDIAGVVETV